MAFLVLTVFCFFYHNLPLPVSNPNGATDYVSNPNTFYVQFGEGLGWGRTNNEGFVESIDYREGMPVDVLLMGSSQIEGYQVSQEDTIREKLAGMLRNQTIYSIAISDHVFLACCNNLEAALNRYEPSEAVVIEMSQIAFSIDSLRRVTEGTIPEINRGSQNRIYNLLARNPFLRLFHKQIVDYFSVREENATVSYTADSAEIESTRYVEALDAVLQKLSDLCKQHDTSLILFYYPETRLDHDGNLLFDTDPEALRVFREGCERHGITFVDMTDAFARLYQEEHRLPYGFANTQVGKGHFNVDGHRLVAEELCAAIQGLEGKEE